ncbi:MAG: dihydroneopterin aldolase [Acidobacteriota bacterium]|nr:dihydroneopterin aldolase [Acidobacteriota bacterium]
MKRVSSRTVKKRRLSEGAGGILEVDNIECRVHIGVDEEERSVRQRVVVDLVLERIPADESRRALSRDVRVWVRHYLESGRFVLIEAASLGLARVIFANSNARRVFIRFYKFVLPQVEHVAVEMTFDRSEVSAA